MPGQVADRDARLRQPLPRGGPGYSNAMSVLRPRGGDGVARVRERRGEAIGELGGAVEDRAQPFSSSTSSAASENATASRGIWPSKRRPAVRRTESRPFDASSNAP